MTALGPAKAADVTQMLEVAGAIGFDADELRELRSRMEAFVSGTGGDGECWHVGREADDVVSVAYVVPELMAVGAWNLLLLAVRPDRQRRGFGESTLRHVERTLAADNARLLLIETSATGSFAPARAFYLKNGYDEEARIRDYYDAGDDKIVFRKLLAAV